MESFNRNISIVVNNLNAPNRYACALITNLKRSDICLVPGMVSETFDLVLSLSNISYNIHWVPGGYRETVESVESGEFDTLLVGMTPNMNRLSRFNFSVPVPTFEEELMVLFADRVRENYLQRALSFLQVYDVPTWFILLLVVFVHNIFKRVSNAETNRKYLSANSFLWTGFFIMMLTALYRNGLLARLLTVHDKAMVTDLNDLVDQLESGEIRLVIQKNPPWIGILHETKDKRSGIYRLRVVILDLEMTDRIDRVDQFANYESESQRGTHVLLTYGFIASHLATKWCGVTVLALNELDKIENAIMFGSTVSRDVIEVVNEVIMLNLEIWMSLQRRYSIIMGKERIQKQENCSNKMHAENISVGSLGVVQMSGMFLILLFGSVVAVCVFGFEKLICKPL